MSLTNLLPLLEEVFHSNLWVLLAFSVIVSCFITRTLRPRRQVLYVLLFSFVLYLLCELLLHWIHAFLPELLVLFLGTFALGTVIGSLLAWLEYQLRKHL